MSHTSTIEEQLNAKQLAPVIYFLEKIEKNKQSHFWHGGAVVEIRFNERFKVYIEAIGSIRANIYRTDNGVAFDQEFFTDENGCWGNFGYWLRERVSSDEELYESFHREGDGLHIEILNNNWWEAFLVVDNEFYDIMHHALDSNGIFDAVHEVMNTFWDFDYETFIGESV